MQIVICDDIKAERDTLREHIYCYSCSELLDYVIDEYEKAACLLDDIKSNKICPDILFMDIYMDGMTGIDAVKALKADGFSGTVIFTTTSESHAVESYKIMAQGYLVKPFTRAEFYSNFEKAVREYTASHKIISFPCNRLQFSLLQKDLEYVETVPRGCLLHAKGEVLTTTKPISDFAAELLKEDCFLRSHRGCIVNLNFVAQVGSDDILMKSGARVPFTIKDRAAIKKAVSDYFFLKMRGE